MQEAKSNVISKQLVMQAWLRVKANHGSEGIDKQTIGDFELNLKDNLYKIWNRMSSGSYLPKPVKLVEIPKDGGKTRNLGIPTVSDRVAQMVVVLMLEPDVEMVFHPDSYGYRPKRSAHDALKQAKERCWKYDWVLDMDIKGFFDNIDHELLMKALERHTKFSWIILYVKRWLTVPYELSNGDRIERNKGVPQGSVIGPLLANLFLHYAFDEWMRRNYPAIPFERYADDTVCHCRTKEEAEKMKVIIGERLAVCKLELNEIKTKIVYCKDSNRKEDWEFIQFNFLGYTFRPRMAKNNRNQFFCSFLPAISNKARKHINEVIRSWWKTSRTDIELKDLAKIYNPYIRGWIVYYGKFYFSKLHNLFGRLNQRLVLWVTRKFKRFRRRPHLARLWLYKVFCLNPKLFTHWEFGIRPYQW